MKLGTVSIMVRRGVVLLILFVIFYYITTLIVIPVGSDAFGKLFPNRDKPNPIYGALDNLEMVSRPILNSNPLYELNTKNGKLPNNLPINMPVYRLRTPQFSYEAGRNAQAEAATLGYTDADLISDLKGDVYKWQSRSTGAYLEIELKSRDLSAITAFQGKESFFTVGSIDSASAVTTAKTLLQKLNRFSDLGYQSGTQTVYLGRFTPTGIVETKEPKEAQIARVDFFRTVGKNPATKKPYLILGNDAKKGLLSIFVRRPDTLNPTLNAPKADIYFKEAETETQATYPIVPVSDVWKIVSGGNGIISSVVSRDSNPFTNYRPVRVDKVLINDIYLAYYEPNKFHKYLWPIYVFEGNYTSNNGGAGSITIYYPALTAEYVKPIAQQSKQPTTESTESVTTQ